MAEWRAACGNALSAVQPMLEPLDERAPRYPNPRAHSLPMKVVQHPNGSIVAIDEHDHRNRLRLTPADVVVYRLDLRAFRTMLCGALDGVAIAKTPVSQSARRLQVGNWEPKKAACFPVYILLVTGRDALRREALDLIASCKRSGAILLTPSREHWSEDLADLMRQKNALLVPLCEVLEAADGVFRRTDAWEEYLQMFCKMVKLTLPGNYRNRKPTPRRAELTAKIEKTRNALVEHIRSAKDYAIASSDAGRGPQLIRALTKIQLAKLAGLKPYHVTRCFRADPQLKELYRIANDPEKIMRFGRR